MERLTERSKNSDMVWFKDPENDDMRLEPCEMSSHHSRMAIEKLAAYEDAEEQGVLLRLPCKVGDTVYVPTRNFISELRITEVTCDRNGIYLRWVLLSGIYPNLNGFAGRKIGNEVFLTKSEAEAKLAERSCFQNGNS